MSVATGVSAAAARRSRRKLALTAVAVVAVGVFVFPLYWMVSTSLKVDNELFTVGAFSFVMAWGEFTLGLTLATETDVQPVTVTLNSFIGQYGTRWAPLMAASTVVAVPIVVLFVLFQRFIASGLTAGSVKD
jgi:ABC-type glycerol-3-phosphate transport system permease component